METLLLIGLAYLVLTSMEGSGTAAEDAPPPPIPTDGSASPQGVYTLPDGSTYIGAPGAGHGLSGAAPTVVPVDGRNASPATPISTAGPAGASNVSPGGGDSFTGSAPPSGSGGVIGTDVKPDHSVFGGTAGTNVNGGASQLPQPTPNPFYPGTDPNSPRNAAGAYVGKGGGSPPVGPVPPLSFIVKSQDGGTGFNKLGSQPTGTSPPKKKKLTDDT